MASDNAQDEFGADRDTSSLSDPQRERVQRYGKILADFARSAPEASSLDRLLRLVSVQAARAIGIGHSKVLRYRPEAGDLLMVAGVGWNPDAVGHTSFGGDLASPSGRTLQTRQPVILEDAPQDLEFRYAPLLRDHGVISLLNAPVSVDGVVWGVLEVDSTTRRHFNQDDVWFLSALANIFGLALYGRMALRRANDVAAKNARALDQEQFLLEELRHRSKNDLQLILTMLILQRRKQADRQAQDGFSDVMDRVAAISIAHDHLTPGRGAGQVELSHYLQALCGNLGKRREDVCLEVDLTPTEIPNERAVPLGLIVNELVTNSLKYAFPNDGNGTIRVSFSVVADGEGRLQVFDDGIGMGTPRPGSSGAELVRRLVQQVGGRLNHEPTLRGTSFVINFPMMT